jgi:hypothetical protein
MKTITKNDEPSKSSTHVLIKTAIILPLIVFGLWMLKLLYLPSVEARKTPAVDRPSSEISIFQRILMDKKPLSAGHFHMLDGAITLPEPFHPLCTNCHGTYSHSKEKKVRSLLNFHTGFMACSVCHVRKASGDRDYFFVWVDRQTGRTTMSVKGEFGKYPAKIFPMQITARGQKKLFRPVSEKAAEEFLRLKDKFTPDGYINFTKLGFPKNRVDHLISTEVAGMIENYETFYLPEVIDFGAD